MEIAYLYWFYLLGTLVVAVRFGWHMVFRLDHLDWHYGKFEIWLHYLTLVILWPFLIFGPRLLLDPSTCFKGIEHGQAERQREEERLRASPPPCGNLISYRQAPGYDENTFGEFVFLANDVHEHLALSLKNGPHLQRDHEGAMMNWLLQRDTSIDIPTPVPTAWHRFGYIADELVRLGRAKVRCLTCGESTLADSCTATNEGASWGWRHNRLYCSAGHILLTVRMMHVMRPIKRAKASSTEDSKP